MLRARLTMGTPFEHIAFGYCNPETVCEQECDRSGQALL